MFELFNSDTKELRATNQDLQIYTYSCHKDSERCAKNYIDSDSINPQN